MSRYTKQLEQQIKADLVTLTDNDIELEYGIQINKDKSVYDLISDKRFLHIDDWLEDYLGETDDSYERIGSKGVFDDNAY